MTRAVLAAVVLLAAAAPLPAQAPPDGSAARAAIERLAFMEGTWRGEAWMDRGRGREQTVMTETVRRKLGGAILEVEGIGMLRGEGGAAGPVVHNAFGVIYFDPQANGYVLRSWIATGQWGDFALTMVEGGVSWTREVPGGRIRNTARFTADEWHEIGEFSRDGVTWRQTMEIRLRRETGTPGGSE